MKRIMQCAFAPTLLASVTLLTFIHAKPSGDDVPPASPAALQSSKSPFRPLVTQSSSTEERIRIALAKTNDFLFVDNSLADFFEFVRKHYDINLLVSENELRACSVELNDRFSLSLKDATLSSALKQVLAPRGLDFMVKHDSLSIVSRDTVLNDFRTVVYPAVDLVLVPKGKQFENIDVDLIDLVTRTIEPDSWEDNGGDGRIESYVPTFSLVVTQTEVAHEQLRLLFASLRKTRACAEEYARNTYSIPLSEIHRLIDERSNQDHRAETSSAGAQPNVSNAPLQQEPNSLQQMNAVIDEAKRITEQASQIERTLKQEITRRGITK
jgi:hypothetical protein